MWCAKGTPEAQERQLGQRPLAPEPQLLWVGGHFGGHAALRLQCRHGRWLSQPQRCHGQCGAGPHPASGRGSISINGDCFDEPAERSAEEPSAG